MWPLKRFNPHSEEGESFKLITPFFWGTLLEIYIKPYPKIQNSIVNLKLSCSEHSVSANEQMYDFNHQSEFTGQILCRNGNFVTFTSHLGKWSCLVKTIVQLCWCHQKLIFSMFNKTWSSNRRYQSLSLIKLYVSWKFQFHNIYVSRGHKESAAISPLPFYAYCIAKQV